MYGYLGLTAAGMVGCQWQLACHCPDTARADQPPLPPQRSRVVQASAVAICVLGVALLFAPAARGQQVTVTPEESDEILTNPGMGWETFHRTSQQDPSLPAWIPSTVGYVRWGWGELEPQPGKLNSGLLDKALKAAHDSGQKLAFRVMCCSTTKNQPYHPQWLKQIGGRELSADYDGQGPFPIPDLDDPIVLQRHLDFIQRLGAKYDGHPDLDHVDLGSIGWWGEWHLSRSKDAKLPTLDNRQKVVDAYLAAFPKTPLLMLVNGGPCLKYATEHGTGWRADCLGDLGGAGRSWSHMRKGYPTWIQEAGVQDVWKQAPVAWETCWDLRKWVAEGWSLRYIFNYALACHASVINNKSAPLPTEKAAQAELRRFLRRLGYRFVLRELTHPAQAQAGATLSVSMQWQNVGSAPCYRPYRVAYRLSDEHGTHRTLVSEVTVNRWLPGSVELFTAEFFQEPKDLPPGELVPVADTVPLPADLPSGRYTLSVGIVDPVSSSPSIALAIQGRNADGWYPLSTIQLVNEKTENSP